MGTQNGVKLIARRPDTAVTTMNAFTITKMTQKMLTRSAERSYSAYTGKCVSM